jgi:hypothetical protein
MESSPQSADLAIDAHVAEVVMGRIPRFNAVLVVALGGFTIGPLAGLGAGEGGSLAPRALGVPRRSAFDRPLNAFDVGAVERARAGAARWLQDPECLKVLAEFTDRQGQTLDRRLEAWDMSAADYLRALPFQDGTGMQHCDQPRVVLVTILGLPAVYLCPRHPGDDFSLFSQTETQHPSVAKAMVIHEMLHTLGLGENPPSSLAITERVQKRCR